MANTRLIKKLFFEGEIEVESGLHMGGPATGYAAGAADALVIRDPIHHRPYLPGSALRGKLRHLLERFDAETEGGEESSERGPSTAGLLFGSRKRGRGGRFASGRLIVRDGALRNTEWLEKRGGLDLPFTEVKNEAAIDRLTAAAAPRQIERVPAGARFSISLILDIREGDDEAALVSAVCRALLLLEDDYLGAHGSRGYGQVRVKLAGVQEKDREIYLSGGDPRPAEVQLPARLAAG